MEISAFKDILKKYGIIFILVWVGCIATTFFLVKKQTPIYASSTTIVAWPQEHDITFKHALDGLDILSRRSVIATYAKIASSRVIADQTFAREEFADKRMLRYKVRTSILPDTNIIKIKVQGPDAQLAAEVADAVAVQAGIYVKEFSSLYQFKVLDKARVSHRQIKPDMRRSLTIAIVFGLFLACGSIFLLQLIRRK